jgi:hypothetical protein
MAMPEAAVHKENLVPLWEYQVGFSWELWNVESIPVAHSMDD